MQQTELNLILPGNGIIHVVYYCLIAFSLKVMHSLPKHVAV